MINNSEHKRFIGLAIAAIGVVYGDIGTSPLYTMREIFAGADNQIPINIENVLGILSLIFWSLIIIVSLKYATFIMRADNNGEGGIMSLMALVQGIKGNAQVHRLIVIGLFGSALFYGDSIITPAISVLSAVEGLDIITPIFTPWIIPITLSILFALFAIQKNGTGFVGAWFGPITIVWFLVIAILGLISILKMPIVLYAVLPIYAIEFFIKQPVMAFLSLGSVVLAVTGSEALYADMGHFGRQPVRVAWLSLVLPSLTLNYFGQGALLIVDPNAIQNPFYHLAPSWMLLPLVMLATIATVIASQAVITGAFSITHQAIQLGYVPRMLVQHTSAHESGQIYLPGVNWTLFLLVAWLVISFKSSTNLAAAYGIAVTGTMLITTILMYTVTRDIWNWSMGKSMAAVGIFFIVDSIFLAANLPKIVDGGWFPLLLAIIIFANMTTWKRGRELLRLQRDGESIPLKDFIQSLSYDNIPLVPGTAVFLSPNLGQVPHALLHSIKHYKCLHEHVVILCVVFLDRPFVPINNRVTVKSLGERFHQVKAEFGFMDNPNLTETLRLCVNQTLPCDLENTTFFLGRETLIASNTPNMSWWRKKLFAAQTRNAGSPAAYFGLPPNRVVELGAQIVL